MKVEVLLATINQTDHSVLDTMNIKTDILVCNQNENETSYTSYERNGNTVRWYNFQEKGVGLNRNNALLRATGDICILADDDIVYEDDYKEKIIRAFEENPKADVILFNVYSDGVSRYIIKKKKRIHLYNFGKYGAVRIAFRREKIIKNSIAFNTLFGGGCRFSAGEDIMFTRDCLRKKLKVIAVPDFMLRVTLKRESTWFQGFDQKYFEDLGSAYCYLYGWLAKPCAFLQLIKGRKRFGTEFSFQERYKFMKQGIKRYKKL